MFYTVGKYFKYHGEIHHDKCGGYHDTYGDIISTVGVYYQYHGYLEYLNLIAEIWKQNTRLSKWSPALNSNNMIVVLYFIALHCI